MAPDLDDCHEGPPSPAIRKQWLPPRLALLFLAIPFQILAEVSYWVWGRHGNIYVLSFCTVLWFVWFALIFLMAVPALDSRLRPHQKLLKIAVICIVLAVVCMGVTEGVGLHLLGTGAIEENDMVREVVKSFGYNDATALTHQASKRLLEGINPYLYLDLLSALEEHDVCIGSVTPLMRGSLVDVFPYPTGEQLEAIMEDARALSNSAPPEFESKVSYPAGSFLFHTPFVAMGLNDLRLFYLLCALAAGAVVLILVPGVLRPLVLLSGLVSISLWNLIATGTLDTLYVLLILMGWLLRSRLWLAVMFMGLAASTKQIAWLYILFFIILVVRERGWRPATASSLGIAMVFTCVNLPFIFGAPMHWLEGVMTPVVEPMFPRGAGIVTFSVAGILPPNAAIFLIMEMLVLVIGAGWYFFRGYRYPQVGLLLAALPLFFAWRSYSCYFYFASLLVFGAVMVLEYRHLYKPGVARATRPP